MEIKFYVCRHCGNIVAFLESSGVPVICCGEEMQELKPNTVDASHEKHVPVITVTGNKVTVSVGSAEHPMTPEHYIKWICIQTKDGNQRKELLPGEKPQRCFKLCDGDQVQAVYAYCNLHGLWRG